MPPRAYWKGYLKLSLVTCPVALFPAASNKEKVSFHLLNGATGHRLKQQYVDSETGAIVDREDRVKGYEVGKGASGVGPMSRQRYIQWAMNCG